MTDIARLPFGSPETPAEQGTLILSDDGTIRIHPSDALRDALAQREEQALALANRWGLQLGLVLTACGLVLIAAGWLAGRTFGKSAGRLIWRRPAHTVSLGLTADHRLQVQFGKTIWTTGICSASDMEQFQQRMEEMKN